MRSVLACTATVVVLAQLALLYALKLHGRPSLGTMWGLAPNQSWWVAFVFPVATFATFVALRVLVIGVAPALPPGDRVRPMFENWIVAAYGILALACLFAIIDYFGSVKSFDKLRPEIANGAVHAFEAARAAPADATRGRSLKDLDLYLANVSDASAAAGRLRSVTPVEYLRVVQSPKLQRRLRILDPVGHALYSLQVLVAVAVGLAALFCATSTIAALRVLGDKAPPLLGNAYRASYVAIVAFALFAIAYRQYRSELEPFVGADDTVIPDYFVTMAVVLVLAALTAINSKGEFDLKPFLSGRLLLLLGVAAAAGIEWRKPALLQKLIGINTTVYIQAIWMLIALIAAFFIGLAIWPRRGLPIP